MMILPCAFWPLAEHAEFGQNCFDASIGSVSVCIYYSMPIDACFFKPSFPFHRIVGSYLLYDKQINWLVELDEQLRYQSLSEKNSTKSDPFATFLQSAWEGK